MFVWSKVQAQKTILHAHTEDLIYLLTMLTYFFIHFLGDPLDYCLWMAPQKSWDQDQKLAMNGFDQVSRHILKLSLLSLICLHYLPTMNSKTFMNLQSYFLSSHWFHEIFWMGMCQGWQKHFVIMWLKPNDTEMMKSSNLQCNMPGRWIISLTKCLKSFRFIFLLFF